MESSVKQRLKEFIVYLKISTKEFETRCGMANGYIAAMRKGLGTDKLNNVLNEFPSLNREWLLYGEGEMIKPHYTRQVYGGEKITQTGNINVEQTAEALTLALNEVAEMRKLLASAIANNQQTSERILNLLEHLAHK